MNLNTLLSYCHNLGEVYSINDFVKYAEEGFKQLRELHN